MNFQSIVDNLVSDTLAVSLPLYWPELALCATIVVLLLAQLLPALRRIDPFYIAFVGAATALAVSAPTGGFASIANAPPVELFTGMLVYDGVTVFMRLVLLAFAVLLLLLTKLTQLIPKVGGQDFYVLLLGATLGMCLMSAANHLLVVFLAIEMASVPSYVLVGYFRSNRNAGEAALKYAVYGAGASGIMLYGISLVAGLLGTAHLPTLASQLATLNLPLLLSSGIGTGTVSLLVLAGLMITVGLAFKLSAVPFHFWCPDVFEGATSEIAGFLSVASKAAALALLVRVTLGVCISPGDITIDRIASSQGAPPAVMETASAEGSAAMATSTRSGSAAPLAPVRTYVAWVIGILAAVTCTFGNLAAFGQTNIKRLLAYSTIAHAGYMMMPVAAAAVLCGRDSGGADQAVASLLIYIGVYLFMNLGAFAVVAFVRNATGSEAISDYAGLIRTAPVLTVCMVVILASLLGLPPLAGFLGKFAAFAALAQAGTPLMIALLVIAAVNTVVSLVYYWRVVQTMCLDMPPETRGPLNFNLWPTAYTLFVTAPLLLIFLFPRTLTDFAQNAAAQLLP